jgi:hypothetical protein
MLQIPTNNHFAGRAGYKPRYAILHGTAGGTSAQGIAQYFQSTEGTANPVSSHYVIGTDGTVVQCVAETDAAWGNGIIETGADTWWNPAINPNYTTISIEHCKPSTDNSDALTSAQQTASFALVADICLRNNIPARPADAIGGVTGHFSIAPQSRANCPGSYPWAALWLYLRGVPPMATPTGWSDNGTTLIASNGVPITLGFRDFVRNSNGWNPANVPLRPAESRNPIMLSNTLLGAGTRQVFRDCVLGWTPATNVFLLPSGQELLAVEQALITMATPANINAAITQANAIITSAQTILTQLK